MQLNHATNFIVKLKKGESRKCEMIPDNRITNKSREDGSVMFFISTNLKTGYDYQFIFENKENEKEHESEPFKVQGISTISIIMVIRSFIKFFKF